jgi:hypothetical protein
MVGAPLCRGVENVDHVIFQCTLVEFVRALFGEALGWEGYPRSMEYTMEIWLARKLRVN